MSGKSTTPETRSSDARRATILKPRPRAARKRSSSTLDVVLDPAQRAAVEQPPGNALLILGEAGHGKTTVAVRRLAHLWRSSPTLLRAAVVVPTDGLARSLQPMLRQLGVDVEVLTYDRWAAAQARRTFRRLPRESDSTPPSVMRLKRHPALKLAIKELATREPGVASTMTWTLPRLVGERSLHGVISSTSSETLTSSSAWRRQARSPAAPCSTRWTARACSSSSGRRTSGPT